MTTLCNASPRFRQPGTARSAILMAALLGAASLALAAPEDGAMVPTAAASGAEHPVTDSWITTKVKSELLANSLSKGFKVSVTTKDGAVALAGKLPNQEAIDLVKSIAERVKGVKTVDTSGLTIGH